MHGDTEGRGILEASNRGSNDMNVDSQPPNSTESLPCVPVRIEGTKIVLVGDKAVGKSALILNYFNNTFSEINES